MVALTLGISIQTTGKTKEKSCASCEDENAILKTIGSKENSYMGTWKPSEKNTEHYRKKLAKWGTVPGVIDVGNGISDAKASSGKQSRKRNLVKDQLQKEHFRKFQKYLNAEFDTLQVTLKNHTPDIRDVCLWGGNSNKPITDPLTISSTKEFSVEIGTHPQGTVYNPANGYLYIANQLSDSISVVNKLGIVIMTISLSKINLPGTVSPVALAVNSNISNAMYGSVYVIGSVSNKMYHINLEHEVVDSFETGIRPSAILFRPQDNKLQVSHIVSKDILIIDPNKNYNERSSAQNLVSRRVTDNPFEDVKVFTQQNRVTFKTSITSPTITVNEEYHEEREDFKFSPGMLKHLKIIASGTRRVNALQMLQKSMAGKEICKTLSLGNYQSPQSFQNVSEVFDVDGYMVDGQNSWCFKIGPYQTITFLLYYKKLEMYNLLPEKSRLATGVEMSKGLPKRVPINPFKF